MDFPIACRKLHTLKKENKSTTYIQYDPKTLLVVSPMDCGLFIESSLQKTICINYKQFGTKKKYIMNIEESSKYTW